MMGTSFERGVVFTISSRLKISDSDHEAAVATNYFEDFTTHMNFSPREVLHLRLLTEETIGMLRAILDTYDGEVWFEGDAFSYKICFSVRASVDPDMRDALLDVSTTGENAASRGIMGKIGTAIANGLSDYSHAIDVTSEYNAGVGPAWRMGVDSTVDTVDMSMYSWSLSRYKSAIEDEMDSGADANDEWDELEKSIVAQLADDVIVGVRGGKVQITLVRNVPAQA